jgi:hypothetical protein
LQRGVISILRLHRAFAIPSDVTDAGSVSRALDATSARAGGVDILVVNAGVSLDPGTVEQSDPDRWRQTQGSGAGESGLDLDLRKIRDRLAELKEQLEDILFRTTDGGRTFESINGDFPGDEIARVVRTNPARKGPLFAGTETGVYCSLNDGQSWVRMGGGLPVAPVYDLKIKGTDLVAGTHGRSFWILDDITPLRGLVDGSNGCRLFEPRTTVRTKLHFGALRSLRPSGVALALAPGVGGRFELTPITRHHPSRLGQAKK